MSVVSRKRDQKEKTNPKIYRPMITNELAERSGQSFNHCLSYTEEMSIDSMSKTRGSGV